ncbi:MAG: carbohydrate kinase [Archangiaceae bacterium]|nr:carbohydrate kinase [Archangiaceae bacterium]
MASSLDIVCVGEALVDLLPDALGKRGRDVEAWTRSPGGAPANVAIGLARLGAKSGLVGVVGEDEFGHFLCERLAADGVDVSRLRRTTEGRTGLAFVSLTETGERSFCFYRVESAETFFDHRDLAPEYVKAARIVHVGTNSLVKPKAREAVLSTVATARAAGTLISCDPNLRLKLWSEPQLLKGLLAELLPQCAVVKLSSDEIAFVLGTTDVAEAAAELARMGVKLAVITEGERGATFAWKGALHQVPEPKVDVVDTTGAGDGFTTGLLYGLTRVPALDDLSETQLTNIVRLGCALGSRVCGALGAVAALPRREQLGAALPVWLTA